MTSQGKQPPRWLKKFLSGFLDERILEGSLGDLEEKYSVNIDRGMPAWRANVLYIVEGLGFLRMAAVKKEEAGSTAGQVIHAFMFFGRLIRKDKSYYLVSMFGLALSLASFLLMTMFIADELSYDSMHENRDRIFRVTTHIRISDTDFDLATSQFPAALALQNEFPEIEQAVRLHKSQSFIEVGEKKFSEDIVFADENFFRVFYFPLLQGDREIILNEPSNVILSEKASVRYFGTSNAIGQEMKVEGQTLRVAGIMQNIDTRSHLKFDILVPLRFQLNMWKSETGVEGREHKWFWIGAYTYLLLNQPGDQETLSAKLPAFVNKYFPERLRGGHFELQKLGDIHLTSHNDSELEPNGDILYIKLFSVVAIVIMIVSSINLINLSYFKISSRIKEVGIRKFLGQNSRKLITQLSIESLLAGVISFTIAVVCCQVFMPQFNLLVDKDLELWTATNLTLTGLTFIVVLVISLGAIARPAIRFASRPANMVLLRDYRNGRATNRFRNLLIGLQVCFSFVLLVFSFVVSSQIDFFRHKDLGFDKNNVVSIEINDNVSYHTLKEEIKKNSAVVDITGAEPPGKGYSGWRFVPEGGSYGKPIMLPFTFCDPDFLRTMRVKLLAGRNLAEEDENDSLMLFLINRKAAIELGWNDDAIGRRLEVFAPGRTEIMGRGKVIGLIDDYHAESLHDPVKPVVITYGNYFGNILVRVTDVNGEAIESLESIWKKFSAMPFRYSILDEQLDRLYVNEDKLSKVILFFAFVALYLTCYGLFAMSSLVFSSKLKEVAIRKVFGAGEGTIMKQFYRGYALFNFVALLIGLPIAIWLGNLWLQTFQYRIDLSYMFFIKAAVLILVAGMLSVSYYLAKVAWSNPLPFLRRD
ncbi:MAG TPA: ABC transporter permease [Cyclobacteriaceae bacterium]|nr:ABC transporter permease [Cyclobacteriaceae bacterium]